MKFNMGFLLIMLQREDVSRARIIKYVREGEAELREMLKELQESGASNMIAEVQLQEILGE